MRSQGSGIRGSVAGLFCLVIASTASNSDDAFVPDRVVVRYSETRSTGPDGNGASTALTELFHRFGVLRSRPLFGASAPDETTDQRVRRIRTKLGDRSAAVPPAVRLPAALAGVHLLELAPGADVGVAATALAADPDVAWAHPDYLVHSLTAPDDPFFHGQGSWGQSYGDLWGLGRLDLEAAWSLSTGDPRVVVAVVDSGLDLDHPDIRDNVWSNQAEADGDANGDGCPGLCGVDDDGDGRVDEDSAGLEPGDPGYAEDLADDDDENGLIDDRFGWDFTTCARFAKDGCAEPKEPDNDPSDGYGHGTHVTGTIAAVGDNGTGVVGVLWRARIMPLKALNDSGSGAISDLSRALVYAADQGAHVINNSWGVRVPGEPPQLLREAVEYAWAVGALSVAAAGNSNRELGDDDFGFFPACLDRVVSVAAFDQHDRKTSFSNWGAQLDVAAPGGGTMIDPDVPDSAQRNILSLRARNTGNPDLVVDEDYIRAAGTSMASPHAAGLAALILSHRPELTPREVRLVLQVSATDVDLPGFDLRSGHGRIHARRGLEMAERLAAERPAELFISAIEATPDVVVPGESFEFAADVANLGVADGADVRLELYDGDPADERLLQSWELAMVGAGQSHTVRADVALADTGRHTLQAWVNPDGQVEELSEVNNRRLAPLFVLPYRIARERLPLSRPATSWPAVSDDRIVWIDKAAGREHVVLYYLGPDGLFGTADDTGPESLFELPPQFTLFPKAATIEGRLVVWESYQAGAEYDIYLYDLGADGLPGGGDDRGAFRLTSHPSRQQRPVVSANTVAWSDDRDGRRDVYLQQAGADGLFGSSDDVRGLRLTDDPRRQELPAISGRRIVWLDARHGYNEIYLHDLGRDGIFGSGDDAGPIRLTRSDSHKDHPDIDGHRIVWQDHRHGDADIYFYDLGDDGLFATDDDSGEVRLTDDPHPQERPRISGPRIAWTDGRHGDQEIYFYELGADGRPGTADDVPDTRVTRDSGFQHYPAISGDDLVWEDQTDGSRGVGLLSIVNHAPVLAPIGDRVGAVHALMQFVVEADDAEGRTLEFGALELPRGAVLMTVEAHLQAARRGPNPGRALRELQQSLPPGIDTATQLFRWTPDGSQAGAHGVTFTVRDDHPVSPLSDRETVRLQVRSRPAGPLLLGAR